MAKTSDGEKRKTTVELPTALWRAAKIRAMDEGGDLRSVIIAALEAYLKSSGGDEKRSEEPPRPGRRVRRRK
jgi:hypothetical protein